MKNIVLILADQLRADALSPYGGRCIQTGQLAWLASEGAAFDTCYANNPICTPGRWTWDWFPGPSPLKIVEVSRTGWRGSLTKKPTPLSPWMKS